MLNRICRVTRKIGRLLTSREKASAVTSSQAGFTMLELLVVLAILGLLATIATPALLNQLGRAKTETARIQIQSLSTAIDLFRLDTGRLPTSGESLAVLRHKPPSLDEWNGPYVTQEASLTDPWGEKYVYKSPGDHGEFDLFSLGADRAVGGTGEDQDVTNW